jgi:hypothetical protein
VFKVKIEFKSRDAFSFEQIESERHAHQQLLENRHWVARKTQFPFQ